MSSKLLSNSVSVNPAASYLLDQFAIERRGVIGNRFFKAARDGAVTVEELIRTLKADTITRMLFAKLSDWSQERHLLTLLESEEARVYAREVLNRESLPPAEKQMIKAERSEQYRREYLKAQKPTERQIRYLKSLGCNTIPSNRLQASELIEEAKA